MKRAVVILILTACAAAQGSGKQLIQCDPAKGTAKQEAFAGQAQRVFWTFGMSPDVFSRCAEDHEKDRAAALAVTYSLISDAFVYRWTRPSTQLVSRAKAAGYAYIEFRDGECHIWQTDTATSKTRSGNIRHSGSKCVGEVNWDDAELCF